MKLQPSVLLIFGNPPLGTQFITANANAGLDWAGTAPHARERKKRGLDRVHGFQLDRATAWNQEPQ